MHIKTPTPLTKWKTSDDRVHDTQELARRHEVFLAVAPSLPNHTDSNAAHKIICALAARYDFIERSTPHATTEASL